MPVSSCFCLNMGNKKSKIVYVAKETYTPPVPPQYGDEEEKRRFELLSIQVNDELISKEDPDSNNESTVNIELGVQRMGIRFYFMKNRRTKERGYVMADYMAKKDSIDAQPWYFGKIGRGRAECFLAQEVNIAGSYLIRESETKKDSFALSVKVYDEKEKNFAFRHFHIKTTGEQFFITAKQKFDSLGDLAEAVSKGSLRKVDIKFTNICQRPRPSTFNEIGAATGQFVIAREDVTYDQEDHIGGGHFGDVYKGKFRGTFDVAIKTLRADDGESGPGAEKARREFLAETEILQQLHHPNLVQVFGICVDRSPFLMIVEYLPKGDLRKYLLNAGEGGVTFEQLLSICENIASGMQALEEKGIVHRDLAARNVMLDRWLQAKVGDFGLARQDSEYDNKNRSNFPVKWTAPESIERRVFTHKSDVWSFGVVLWEIFSFGAVPYPTKRNAEVLGYLKKGGRLPMPEYKSAKNKQVEGVYSIMQACWHGYPQQRPNFENLCHDFKDFDAAEERYADYSRTAASAAAAAATGRVNKSNSGSSSKKRMKTPPATASTAAAATSTSKPSQRRAKS